MKSLFKWLLRIVVALVVLAALGYVGGRLFLFDIAQVEGTGMLPTLGPNAYIMSWKRAEPQRGDIVLFARDGEFRARRVIALPGETIKFDDFTVVVEGNRAQYEERYEVELDGRRAKVLRETLGGRSYNVINIDGRRMAGQPRTRAKGGYYVLSDNREVGVNGDSRQLGTIKPSEIRGVVHWVLDPGDRPEPVVNEPLAGKPANEDQKDRSATDGGAREGTGPDGATDPK